MGRFFWGVDGEEETEGIACGYRRCWLGEERRGRWAWIARPRQSWPARRRNLGPHTPQRPTIAHGGDPGCSSSSVSRPFHFPCFAPLPMAGTPSPTSSKDAFVERIPKDWRILAAGGIAGAVSRTVVRCVRIGGRRRARDASRAVADGGAPAPCRRFRGRASHVKHGSCADARARWSPGGRGERERRGDGDRVAGQPLACRRARSLAWLVPAARWNG